MGAGEVAEGQATGREPILDAHAHLGDILYPGGGALIGAQRPRRGARFDPVSFGEAVRFRDPFGFGPRVYRWIEPWVTRAERARNFTATYANCIASLEASGVTHSVCLPVAPHLRFDDLEPVAARDPRLIPFTSVDFEAGGDPAEALAKDAERGARGLKLHPILQREPLSSEATRRAVAACQTHGLPVLFHCGISSYYVGSERGRECPLYGAPEQALELVRAFPEVRFVAGHAGLFQVGQVMRLFAGMENVWVDTSFQSVARVRELVERFGPERVLFASDWPFGRRRPALAIVRAACEGDRGLERRLLWENGAALLGLAPPDPRGPEDFAAAQGGEEAGGSSEAGLLRP